MHGPLNVKNGQKLYSLLFKEEVTTAPVTSKFSYDIPGGDIY